MRLRSQVASDPELVQKIYDETQRLERENETSKKVLESYGIEDGRVSTLLHDCLASSALVVASHSRDSLLRLHADD